MFSNSTTQACFNHSAIVAFLATVVIEPTTFCLQGRHANHLTKSPDAPAMWLVVHHMRSLGDIVTSLLLPAVYIYMVKSLLLPAVYKYGVTSLLLPAVYRYGVTSLVLPEVCRYSEIIVIAYSL